MGKLFEPGLGEVVDRLSILSLKIAHGRLRKRDVAHFVLETTQLLQREYENRVIHSIGVAPMMELAAVNGALWQKTDDLRRAAKGWETPAASHDEAVDTAVLGIEILRLNDRRAELVAHINLLAGAPHLEKL